jgi:hypothetical protein
VQCIDHNPPPERIPPLGPRDLPGVAYAAPLDLSTCV